MVRSTVPAGGHGPTIITLARMLSRLHETLILPDPENDAKLIASSAEREKLADSIHLSSSLLLQLEQEALNIKNPNKKQETQAELYKKRELIVRLRERLTEFGYNFIEANLEIPEDDTSSSGGEDLLGAHTPSSSPSHASHASTSDPTPILEPEITSLPEPELTPPPPHPEPEPSTLRARNPNTTHAQEKQELLGSSTGTSTSQPLTATTEALLTHNRTEQESLTNSLLSMASALKSSSQAFSSSLESEKDIVDRAAEGMDKNTTGLEQASKKMGMLRSMSEGRGWLGRMLLYAWIAGLAVLAVLIVFVGPKLRFGSGF